MWHVVFERQLIGYLMGHVAEEGESFRTTDGERELILAGLQGALQRQEIDERTPAMPVDWVPILGWHGQGELRNLRSHVDVVVQRPNPALDAVGRTWELQVIVELSQGIEHNADACFGLMIRRAIRLEQWLLHEAIWRGLHLPGWMALQGWEATERTEGLDETEMKWRDTRTFAVEVSVNLAALLDVPLPPVPVTPSGATYVVTQDGLVLVTQDGQRLVVQGG